MCFPQRVVLRGAHHFAGERALLCECSGCVCLPKQPGHVKLETWKELVLKLVGICVKLVKLVKLERKIRKAIFLPSFTSFTQIPTSFSTSYGQVSQVSHVCAKAGVSKPLQVVHVCGLSKASLSKAFARRQRDGAERRARTQKTMDSLREMSGVSSYSKAVFAFQSSLDM